MMELVAVVAVGVSLFGAVLFVGWLIDRSIKREADALHDRAREHERRLSVASTELHFARSELSRVQSEIAVVRAQLEGFIHAPPSIRPPSLRAP